MKTATIATAFLLVDLSTSCLALAQGTLYVSNLGRTPVGNAAIASDSWVAQEFFTGTNSGGYIINSIQLLMDAPSGNPSGFAVSIYSYDYTARRPGTSLGSLSGLAPSALGVFTYSTGGIILVPGIYLVVLTSQTPVADGAYNWSAGPGAGEGGDTRGEDGWTIGHLYHTSTDGSNWAYSRDKYFQMAIYATPVPEPSAACLIVLAGGVLLCTLACWRRWHCCD